MDRFSQEIQQILNRQQILEFLKANRQNANISHNIYAAQITAQCRNRPTSVEQFKTVLAYLCIVFILFAALLLILCVLLNLPVWEASTNSSPTANLTQSPLEKAEAAIKSGDYDTARAILTDKMEEYPYGTFYFITYSRLCQLEGRHDEAAMTMINFLNNVNGTQNVQTSNNQLYIQLKELTGPFSPDVEKSYQECVTACEESIENFNFLKTLIENKKYKLALRFCDSMRQENVTDYQLYTYYFTCYTELGEYEECASYFLSLVANWNEISYTDRLLLESPVQNNLDKLKPHVSAETQEKIDAACLQLDQD
ncbi:MAG: hypothetical protein K2N44_10140 [Lachnospiraceae bacterium]|nr:hypothetical protein [Lachnospiraceae bacterium]